jgi:SAM-dependent methyltransferase
VTTADAQNSHESDLDAANAHFWDELCGTTMARELGITDLSAESLRRFDAAYLNFYPYLSNYVPPSLKGERVLEIGLGFGTLGQLLAERGANYFGLDISQGPVDLMRQRLEMMGVQDAAETVEVGSALAIPHPEGSFDQVFSIGCLHHTGDVALAIREVARVLRPGGVATIMVYNHNSFRRIVQRMRHSGAEQVRASYDANSAGAAAPATEFVARADVPDLFSDFAHVSLASENFQALSLRGGRLGIPRRVLLGKPAAMLGLDLYIVATR